MLQSGDIISRYRIIGPLGKGGMGEVYHAEDQRLQRPVALKFLPPEALTESDRKRFLNEAQAAAVIRHPNICPIYDVEEADGQIFISMAYLEGETLQQRIQRGPLPLRDVIDIGVQLAGGLDKAHELGIVHRDIKSNNIIVSADGHASILDFGLALRSGAAHLTKTGKALGTPAYMSPEQIRGGKLDGRTDIWALGVVLYEMLTGEHPFRHDQEVTVIYAILSTKPVPAGQLRPDIPAELLRVVEMALQKDAEKRWRRARDIVDELRKLQESRSGASLDKQSQRTQTIAIDEVKPRFSKRMIAISGAAVAGLVMAAILGRGYFKTTQRPIAVKTAESLISPLGARQIAVLPFQVIGSDANAGVVADGMVEVLTGALAGFQTSGEKWMVVPAAEVRNRAIASPQEARRIYGVNTAISGSVQPLGKKLQFTLNLVDTVSMRQLESKTFEYDSLDPVQSRNRAVDQMAILLHVSRPPESQRAVSEGDSSAPSAYAAYLEGRGLLQRYDMQGNVEKAILRFQQATNADPNYALAWAGLGEAYWRQSRRLGAADLAKKAIESAERAVTIDPSMAIVHTTLGAIYGTSGRDEEAIRELKKAAGLAPSSAEPPRELAGIYARMGRFKESEELYQQAAKARPTDWYVHYQLAILYYQHEKYDDAEKLLRKTLALAPGNELVSRRLGMVLLQQGRYEDAIQELQTSLKIKSNAGTYLTLGAAFFYQHRVKDAVAAVETAIDLEPNRYYYWGNVGSYYKWLPGEEGKSAPALQKAIELADRLIAVTPKDYDLRADLAEYRARLGDKKGAMAEIDRIPDAEQQSRAARLALAFELTGNRAKAIELIRAKLTNPASLTQIKNDPDLQGLWNDPRFQAAIPQGAIR